MTPDSETWQESNQRRLCGALDRVYAAVVRHAGGASEAPAAEAPAVEAPPPALEHVERVLGLTGFERDLLLWCAGMELQSRFAEAAAAPSFGLALMALPQAHWSAISRDRPLRHWRLVEVGPGPSLLRSPLRIDERILHYLAGVTSTDERVEAVIRPATNAEPSVLPSHTECARRASQLWAGNAAKPLLLTGRRSVNRRIVAQEICRLLDLESHVMHAADVPANPAEREQLARLWNREALLTSAALTIAVADADAQEVGRVSAFVDLLRAPVLLEARDGVAMEAIEGFRVPVPEMEPAERKALWVASLGAAAASMNGSLDRLADYFDFDPGSIRLVGEMARRAAGSQPDPDVERFAWQACRVHARRTFEGLAQRIESSADWDDLILPEVQTDTLRQIAAQLRQRALVHGTWGFAERYTSGLGVTALFAGASGTGKTLAAEVLARQLDLDLYRIDLSGVVSKYIGETEKNLRRVFEAAQESGAVLLFDEADALFGKRSEVRDSHDRYANIEISYLLQRMEAYHGLAILTTNMKHALDQAFLRRIRFIVQFPFPGTAERKRIWQRVFPARTPLGTLDFDRAAQLSVPGGVIRNIATHAAFLAADEKSAVEMEHVLRAARVEYAKLEQPLTPAETAGWT
jgi:ATPase family protein associated with various cellular activities (AAA)/winged helix domain-containing protein